MPDYTFRPVTLDDYELFKRWLVSPHIDGWWAAAETEFPLIKHDMGNPNISMNVVELDGTPFAYIQDYDALSYGSPQYSDLPDGTRAMDTFLGEPDFLGKGHGSGYIAQRLDELRPRYGQIVVDPDAKNERAIRAYTRAGFRKSRLTISENGDLVQVMIHP